LEEIRVKYAKRDETFYFNLFQTQLKDRVELLLLWSGFDASTWTAEKYKFYDLLSTLDVRK